MSVVDTPPPKLISTSKIMKKLISVGGLVIDICGRQAEINFGGAIILVRGTLGLDAS